MGQNPGGCKTPRRLCNGNCKPKTRVSVVRRNLKEVGGRVPSQRTETAYKAHPPGREVKVPRSPTLHGRRIGKCGGCGIRGFGILPGEALRVVRLWRTDPAGDCGAEPQGVSRGRSTRERPWMGVLGKGRTSIGLSPRTNRHVRNAENIGQLPCEGYDGIGRVSGSAEHAGCRNGGQAHL